MPRKIFSNYSDEEVQRIVKMDMDELRSQASPQTFGDGYVECDGTKAGCKCLQNGRVGFFPDDDCEQ